MARFDPLGQADIPATIELDVSGSAPVGSVLTKTTNGVELIDDGDLKGNSLAAQAGLSGASVTGGALTASEDGDTAQIEADGTMTVNAIERHISLIPVGEIIKPTTSDLTAEEVANTIINNYGQDAICTHTLPTAAANMSFLAIVSSTGNALHYKANTGDKIYLDEVALDDGDKVSLATPAVGNRAVFFTFQTGATSFDWVCNTISGLWTDGGA